MEINVDDLFDEAAAGLESIQRKYAGKDDPEKLEKPELKLLAFMPEDTDHSSGSGA